jgi:hypothetical protein
MVAIQKILSSVLLASMVIANEAPENTDSKKRSVARAHLDKGSIVGIIEFTSNKKGTVNVHLDVTGLPPNSGPFKYQIHENKISSNDNCNNAGDVFNPYDAYYEICDYLDNNSLCAIGDLSGKHGFINTTCFETQYIDTYLSLNSKNIAFIGGKSIVITDSNNNIISCGSIKIKRNRKLIRDLNSDYNDNDNDDNDDSYNDDNDDSYNDENDDNDNFLISKLVSESVISYNVTNSTNYDDGSSGDKMYDSGANMLITSGLVGIIACIFAALT